MALIATIDGKKNLKLRTKFYTGKTILENLPGEINATIIKKTKKISSLIHLYLVSELLLRCKEYLKIVRRRRASRFNDRVA